MTRLFFIVLCLGLAQPIISGQAVAQRQSDYAVWLEAVKREAASRGISARTISAALDGWQPVLRVIELDRRQPEFTQTFWSYLNRAVSDERIATGRRLLVEHKPLLDRIHRRYGVQPRFLVAFWGLESNYGENTGGHRVIDALATLAHDKRRSDFFRAELFHALTILDQGHIALPQMSGSWAGAMGQVQFMPSTFSAYAVDHNGDGRQDIWGDLEDIFASASNFLRQIGWRPGETWGREVRLPAQFDWNLASLKIRKPIGEWQRLGVRRADGGDLPNVDIKASLILPAGHQGPAFLVYANYRAILNWNRSQLYAVAVGHLADRLIGWGPLSASPPAGDRPLSRAEVEEIQRLLLALGFDPGVPDGVIGSKTRSALRGFQRSAKLPADGYATPMLLDRLRQASGS